MPAKRKNRKYARGLKVSVAAMTKQKMAVELKLRGATYTQIAEHMQLAGGCMAAKKIVAAGLSEYFDDRDEMVHRYVAINLARYDQLMRAWFPRALGGTKKEYGKDGIERTVTVEPDYDAAHLSMEAMKAVTQLLGNGLANRLELTGVNGGPVMTAAVDAMAAAEQVRAAFGPAAARVLPQHVVNVNGSPSPPYSKP